MEQKKKCSKCGEEKELSEFSKDKNGKFGLKSKCKSCFKEYYNDNREKILLGNKIYRGENPEKEKEYHLENKERISKLNKIRYINNKDEILETNKIYHLENDERLKEVKKQWRLDNSDHMLEYQREYYNENKDTINGRKRERRKTDPQFKIANNIRCRFAEIIKNYLLEKKESSMKYLGIPIKDFIEFLEQQFLPEMSWENHGKVWEIDHIIPVENFDLTNEEQLAICFHYSNHQPLFKTTKIAKSFDYHNHIGNRNKGTKLI